MALPELRFPLRVPASEKDRGTPSEVPDVQAHVGAAEGEDHMNKGEEHTMDGIGRAREAERAKVRDLEERLKAEQAAHQRMLDEVARHKPGDSLEVQVLKNLLSIKSWRVAEMEGNVLEIVEQSVRMQGERDDARATAASNATALAEAVHGQNAARAERDEAREEAVRRGEQIRQITNERDEARADHAAVRDRHQRIDAELQEAKTALASAHTREATCLALLQPQDPEDRKEGETLQQAVIRVGFEGNILRNRKDDLQKQVEELVAVRSALEREVVELRGGRAKSAEELEAQGSHEHEGKSREAADRVKVEDDDEVEGPEERQACGWCRTTEDGDPRKPWYWRSDWNEVECEAVARKRAEGPFFTRSVTAEGDRKYSLHAEGFWSGWHQSTGLCRLLWLQHKRNEAAKAERAGLDDIAYTGEAP